jgi:hypothetical protein
MSKEKNEKKLDFILMIIIVIISLIILSSTIIVLTKNNSKNNTAQPNNSETADQDQIDTEFLKGKLYQYGMSNVGSGYGNMYAFTSNMEYYYFTSEMDGESRLRAEKGTWEIKDGKLTLTTTRILSAINGSYVDADASYATDKMLINYELKAASVDEIKYFNYEIQSYNEPLFYENGLLVLDNEKWYLGGYSFDDSFIREYSKYIEPLNNETE